MRLDNKDKTMAIKKYDFTPDMCDKLIALGKEGASQKMMYSTLGLPNSAVARFKKDHQEFADALDLAIVHSQSFWERMMLENLNNKGFNSRIAEIALRGQFPGDYREDRSNKVDLTAKVEVDFGSAVNDLIKQLKNAV